MNRRTQRNQLDRIASAGAAGQFDLVFIPGCGLVGSFAAQVFAPCSRRMILADRDIVTDTTTLLAPYPTASEGQPKATIAAQWLADRFDHLALNESVVGLDCDVRKLGPGFYRAVSAHRASVAVLCLDDPDSIAAASDLALRHGIPAVVATVGINAAQVLAFPANPECACYACLELARTPGRPCTRPDPGGAEPTISTPAAGAMSASIAFALARQLVNGSLTRAVDVRINFDGGEVSIMNSDLERSESCICHERPNTDVKPIISGLTTSHTWNDVARALGREGAVLVPDLLPAIEAGSSDASIPLRQLGYPFWPRLNCEIDGEKVLVELQGDAALLGLNKILKVKSDDRT